MKRGNRIIWMGLIASLIVVVIFMVMALIGPAVGNIYSDTVNSFASPPTISVSSVALTATPLAQLLTVGDTRQSQSQQTSSNTSDIIVQTETIRRIILKNAYLTVTVDDPAAKIVEIVALAESMGGWVVSSTTSTYTGRADEELTSGTVTVRVPAERLDEALETIKSGTLSVDNENINGQDVTQEYVDTSSRLKNLQASEQQLLTIMESAETVEDVLAVQRELTNIRTEIEIAQGRINYFDEAAAFSSIRVDVRPPEPGPVEAQRVGWNPGTTAEGALGALVGLLQFTVDAVIVLAIVGLPLVLIVGVVFWVIWRLSRRFGWRLPGRRTAANETATNEKTTA